MDCVKEQSGREDVYLKWALAWVLLVALPLMSCERQTPSPVIAQVGDATLTVDELRSTIPEETLSRATRSDLEEYITQWVREELLYQAAESMGYRKDPRVEERTREARRSIMVDVFLEDELDMRPFIAEEEIDSYYQNNQDSFRREEAEIRAEILWFDDEMRAGQARTAIAGGMSFAEIEADTSFSVTAADLEPSYLSQPEFGEELGDTVFGLRRGTLSNIARVGDNYALIRVIDRQEAGTIRTLEEVRDEIVMRQTSDLWEMKLDELLSRLLELSGVSIDTEAGLEALGEGWRR